jgi:hypothetical protein
MSEQEHRSVPGARGPCRWGTVSFVSEHGVRMRSPSSSRSTRERSKPEGRAPSSSCQNCCGQNRVRTHR